VGIRLICSGFGASVSLRSVLRSRHGRRAASQLARRSFAHSQQPGSVHHLVRDCRDEPYFANGLNSIIWIECKSSGKDRARLVHPSRERKHLRLAEKERAKPGLA
jgi:hypothetical protein